MARAQGIVGRLRRPALGAIAGQLSQAAASLLLQVVAARTLGAEGFAVFALLLAIVVTATGVSTGLVGDSLTVLPRDEPRIRTGLQVVAVTTAILAGVIGWVATWLSGLLQERTAALFGVAVAVYLLEDALRRLLMASMRFWSLVVVDASAAATYLVVLLVAHLRSGIGVLAVVAALVAGQLVASVVAWALLPSAERRSRGRTRPDLRAVLRFGTWRALQLATNPLVLLLARVLIVQAAGRAAYGQLEAARLLTAPATLAIQGLGGYLLASFARSTGTGPEAVRRADRAATLLAFGALGVGGAMAATLPWVGPFVTGGRFPVSVVAVLAWGVVAAGAAVAVPYTNLAVAGGHQRAIFGIRVFGAVLSLAAVVCLVLASTVDVVPLGLAAGSLVSAAVIRRRVLRVVAAPTVTG